MRGLAAVLSAALCVPQLGAVDAGNGECEGGPAATCDCLLGCKVFGGDPTPCSRADDKNAVVEETIWHVMRRSDTECEGIKCVVMCSKRLRCLSHNVKEKCRNVLFKRECDAECEDTTTTSTSTTTITTTTATTTTTMTTMKPEPGAELVLLSRSGALAWSLLLLPGALVVACIVCLRQKCVGVIRRRASGLNPLPTDENDLNAVLPTPFTPTASAREPRSTLVLSPSNYLSSSSQGQDGL